MIQPMQPPGNRHHHHAIAASSFHTALPFNQQQRAPCAQYIQPTCSSQPATITATTTLMQHHAAAWLCLTVSTIPALLPPPVMPHSPAGLSHHHPSCLQCCSCLLRQLRVVVVETVQQNLLPHRIIIISTLHISTVAHGNIVMSALITVVTQPDDVWCKYDSCTTSSYTAI